MKPKKESTLMGPYDLALWEILKTLPREELEIYALAMAVTGSWFISAFSLSTDGSVDIQDIITDEGLSRRVHEVSLKVREQVQRRVLEAN